MISKVKANKRTAEIKRLGDSGIKIVSVCVCMCVSVCVCERLRERDG